SKYERLEEKSLKEAGYKKLDVREPFYFFIPQNHNLGKEYEEGFAVDKLVPANVTGIVTARDALVIDFTSKELLKKIENFSSPDKTGSEVRREFFGNKKAGKYAAG